MHDHDPTSHAQHDPPVDADQAETDSGAHKAFASAADHRPVRPEDSRGGAESSYPPPVPQEPDRQDVDRLAEDDHITVITTTEPPTLDRRAARAILRILIKAAETEGIR